MLCNRPLSHLESACCTKEKGWKGAGGYGKEDPAKALHCVVWACDELEEEAMRHNIILLASWSQVCKYDVTPARTRCIIAILEKFIQKFLLQFLDPQQLCGFTTRQA